ncbi:Uncharacterized protein TCM_034272 [Theobroma cacao]|uniref:Secreted protein n=1 Tax=Theobroma cacao TaxID=3641 RepID=A0A061FKS2_THECC|nr:Uncharacterized protein TCM_034272 [Theobroma cacao]
MSRFFFAPFVLPPLLTLPFNSLQFDESFSVFLSTNPYLKTYSRLLQVSQGTRAMEDQRAGFDVMSNCRWKT